MTRTLNKRNKKLIFFILFACAVPVINWFVFYVYPNASSVVMAFQNSEGKLSFVNFQRLWTEFKLPTSVIRIAIKNTLITFAISNAKYILFPVKIRFYEICRQIYYNFCANTGFTFYLNCSIVSLYNFFGNGEAKSGTAHFS